MRIGPNGQYAMVRLYSTRTYEYKMSQQMGNMSVPVVTLPIMILKKKNLQIPCTLDNGVPNAVGYDSVTQ